MAEKLLGSPPADVNFVCYKSVPLLLDMAFRPILLAPSGFHSHRTHSYDMA